MAPAATNAEVSGLLGDIYDPFAPNLYGADRFQPAPALLRNRFGCPNSVERSVQPSRYPNPKDLTEVWAYEGMLIHVAWAANVDDPIGSFRTVFPEVRPMDCSKSIWQYGGSYEPHYVAITVDPDESRKARKISWSYESDH